MAWYSILFVAAGGAVGSVARFLIGVWFRARGWTAFPWSTLTVNILGSFILGVLAEVLVERATPARQQWYLLLGTGLCGGFTTFSTFELDLFSLLRENRLDSALFYVAGSVLMGLLSAWLGMVLARMVLGGG